MAEFPFTGNISTSELYKNAPGRERDINPYYAGGQQQFVTPYSEQSSRFAQFGLVAGAATLGLYGAGRAGLRPMSHIYSAARTAEEFSPGQVLRTFAMGDFLSQYTRESLNYRYITPGEVQRIMDQSWFRDLMFRTGHDNAIRAVTHGLTFRGGRLYAGDTLLMENARVITSSGRPNLAAAYSRAAGFKGIPSVRDVSQLEVPINYKTASGAAKEGVFYFTGGPTRTRAMFNQAHGLLTEWVERANRLAASPFEMEPFETITHTTRNWIIKNLHFDPSLSVKSGPAVSTLTRMAAKWGAVGTAAFLGYQTLDWATREAEILDATPFAEGTTAGVASAGVRAHITAARITDAVPGLRAYQRWQEETAPGSTDLLKLAAVPLTGAVSGLAGGYATTVWNRWHTTKQLMRTENLSYSQALLKADKTVKEAAEAFSSSLIPKNWQGRHIPFVGKLGKTKQLGLIWGAVAGALVLPFLPGAILPEKSAEELEDIYSGEQEVAVRKGRWWEFGRSPYEGGRIQYYRPNWYARMLQRSKEKSLGTDDRSPISQWFLENFTYQMEEEHYYDRPYPITGAAFEDVPIIGPLLSTTIGRLFKAPKLMHTEEWAASGEYDDDAGVLRIQGRRGNTIDPEKGDLPPGTPISPYTLSQTLGEQAYRLTELAGLVGFTFSSIKGAITGEDEFFDQEERLQSARRMYGAERAYWDLSLGGGMGTTEFFRRLYPHRRRQIEEYNPIRNTMPTWLPGPGEKAPDFLHGDPFTKVAEGEMRLPGEGYAARFSEVEGLDPEDYPLIHRYRILADIAPYANRTKHTEAAVKAAMKRGELSKRHIELFQETQRQLRSRKVRKEFYEQEYFSEDPDLTIPGSEQSSEMLALINESLAQKQESKSFMQNLFGGYWEAIIAGAQNPLEALTPLAPASKLMHLQTAIEDYERTQLFGSDIAFWSAPVEDFILPFFRETAALFGMKDTPSTKEQQRQIQEYFDTLKYIKNTQLAEVAKDKGQYSLAKDYERAATETLIGVDPYERGREGMRSIFRAMPRPERDYFKSFSSAKNQADRERILEMIPANERRVYQAQWELMYSDEIRKQMEKGMLNEDQLALAERELAKFYDRRDTEGFPATPEYIDQYEKERERGESYADWFRRAILIKQIDQTVGLPGPDWVGWHPSVNLDDIKLKVVKNAGLDIHDFDLWQSDERAAAHRPVPAQAAEDIMVLQNEDFDNRDPEQVQKEIYEILFDLGINANVHVNFIDSEKQDYNIILDLSEVRDNEVRALVEELNG